MTAKRQERYDKLQKTCNELLIRKVGMGWDDLDDTNSCWDHVDESMTDKQIVEVAPDICWDRLYDAGKLKAIEHMIEEDSHQYMEAELEFFLRRLRLLLDGEPVKIPQYMPDAQTLCVEDDNETV